MSNIFIHRNTCLMAAVLMASPALGATGTWSSDADGDWNTSVTAPWQGGIVAEGAGATAHFDAVDLAVTRTVSLTAPLTIGHLSFADTATGTAASWIIGNAASDANTLRLDAATPTITVAALGTNAVARIDAVLAGDDGLVKDGAGVLSLNNANTYSGGTSISAGILHAQNAAALGSGDVTVAAGGRLRLQGGIDIANDLYLNGTSALRSNLGQNVVSGAVTLQSNATVSTQNASNTTLTLGEVDLGSFTMTASTGASNKNIYITGSLTGTGGLNKVNVGDLHVVQNNSATYSGTTTHKRGTIQLGSDNALGTGAIVWTTDNDQTATIRSTDATARTLGNNITLSAQHAGNANARQVFGGGGSGLLSFTGEIAIVGNRKLAINSTTQFNGPVTGGGFTKQNGGVLELNGTNSYSGVTNVAGGALVVNGANNGTGAVNVLAGAALSGSGLIAGDVFFAAGSEFLAVTDGPLDLGGLLTLADGAVIATDAVLTLPSYTVLTFDPGSLSGTFTTDPSISGQDYTVVYGDSAIALQAVPEPASITLLGLAAGLLMGRRRR